MGEYHAYCILKQFAGGYDGRIAQYWSLAGQQLAKKYLTIDPPNCSFPIIFIALLVNLFSS